MNEQRTVGGPHLFTFCSTQGGASTVHVLFPNGDTQAEIFLESRCRFFLTGASTSYRV